MILNEESSKRGLGVFVGVANPLGMIRLVALILFCSTLLNSSGQGRINFQNLAAGLDAPVRDVSGNRIVGPGPYVADLYWSTNMQATADMLVAAGFNQGFSSWTINGGGYFFGGQKIMPAPGLNPILAQVRVWDTTYGSSYEVARDAGGEFGYSNVFPVTLDLPPGGGAYMYGLQPFQLQVIPEPSVQVLAIVCAGIVALRRGMWRNRTG